MSTSTSTPDSLLFSPVVVATATAVVVVVFHLSEKVDVDAKLAKTNAYNPLLLPDEHSNSAYFCFTAVIGIVLESINSVETDGRVLFNEWSFSGGCLVLFVTVYILLQTACHTIACYKFMSAWYEISVSRRELHHYTTGRLRRVSVGTRRICREAVTVYQINDSDEAGPLEGSAKDAASTNCPICLVYLKDGDYATSCDGCSAVFHKECIFRWIEFGEYLPLGSTSNHSSCPCCRKALLATEVGTYKRGLISNIISFMENYRRR